MQNSTAAIAILVSGFVCGLGAWGAADISRNYRGEELQQQADQRERNLKGKLNKYQGDLEVCKQRIIGQEETISAQRICQDKLKKLDADLAIAYGLLKAGPPECAAAIMRDAAAAKEEKSGGAKQD